MKDATYNSVCNTLAEYFEVHPRSVRPNQMLRSDWGLDMLELNIIAARVEELEGIELRSTDLEAVHTVGQLIALVRAIRRRNDLAEEITRVQRMAEPLERRSL
jgi:acyl carrier protein